MSAQVGWSFAEEGWALETSIREGVDSGMLLNGWESGTRVLVDTCVAAKLAIGSCSSR